MLSKYHPGLEEMRRLQGLAGTRRMAMLPVQLRGHGTLQPHPQGLWDSLGCGVQR